jgi:hypothetical protein
VRNKKQSFYSVENVKEYLEIEDSRKLDEVFTIRLMMDPKTTKYIRQVENLADVIGNIGGTIELISIFCGFIVGFISQKLFIGSLLTNLYKVPLEKKKLQQVEPIDNLENTQRYNNCNSLPIVNVNESYMSSNKSLESEFKQQEDREPELETNKI